jgi:hypothetical protein
VFFNKVPSIDNVQHASRRDILPLFFVVVLALRQQGCVHPPPKSPKYLGVRSVIFERENLACDKAKTRRKALCLASGFNAAAG